MGLNAYFTYQVVGVKGQGSISYRVALTAIFIEGLIFMLLAVTGMRHWLVRIIPTTIKIASGVGIGLFLTLVGMSYTSGIGIVTGSVTTPLAIAGCPTEDLNGIGECESGLMTNPKATGHFPTTLRGIANTWIDVDWHHLRRHTHDLLDGISRQRSHHHWHRRCLYSFMAVSGAINFAPFHAR